MADIPEHLKLENQLCFPIHVAANLVAKSYRPLLEPLGLTYPQYLVMLVLWERKTTSVGELAKLLYLDSGTLTPMLKRMELAGLLMRNRNLDDERRVDIDITAKGESLMQDAVDVPQSMVCKLDAPLDWLNGIRLDIKELLEKLQSQANK
ncbi:MarR family winged helix-turn-helix transcriptional regulator [Halioxenophilus aromaticivorans]|uniref:MarR family winged helix-turn-helix transcriptional regulator n=1 Tax=Halioxenophilus aromaticivorans TaxID=1306992 RepID=A0AAV3U1A0_9ALTE